MLWIRIIDLLMLYVGLWVYRVSMSLEKFFCGENSGFLFVFWALLRVLNGVSGSVWQFLA
jgi:hypothetical protein